jgi:O-antigen/teichoic acid export membrane protein
MRRHVANASYLFTADIVARALNFVAVAWMARVLAPALYGTVVIGASVLDYALLLCDWGLKTLGTRETAMPGDRRAFAPHTIATARLALTLTIFVVAQIALAVLPIEPRQAMLVRIYLLGLIPYSLLLDWYHQGRGSFAVITVGRVVGSVLIVAGAVALVRTPGDAVRIPWIYVASMTATTLVLLVAARGAASEIAPSAGDLQRAPSLLRVSGALGVAALFGQSFVVLPPIVAGQFLGTAEAGVLYAALRLVLIALIIDRVFAALYLPALARVWQEDRERASSRLDAAFRLVVALGVGASTMALIFSHEIVALVYGERYAGAGDALALLAPFIAATLVNTFFAYGLIAIGEERLYLRSGLRSGALFVALLLAATPLAGIAGIAVAMVVGECVMTALLWHAFGRHVRLASVRPLAVSLAVGAALVGASRLLELPSLWQAPLYLAAFVVAVLLLRGVSVNDLRAQPR